MPRKLAVELGPSLLVGGGIIASTWVASLAEASGWLVLAGPLLLAVTLVGAVILGSRVARRSPGVFTTALLVGVSFVLAGLILVVHDGRHVTEFIPIMGAAGWVSLLPQRVNRRASCTGAWRA